MSTTIYSNLLYGGGARANNSRTLNTSFQPNASRDTLVIYCIRMTGSQTEGRVDLYTDASNPPTTKQLDTDSGVTASGILGAQANGQADQLLFTIVKAGDYIKLTTVNVTGNPTFSISNQIEITL